MKKLVSVAIAAGLFGAAYSAGQLKAYYEVNGCRKAVLNSLKNLYGPVPTEYQDKVYQEITTNCKTALKD